MAKPLGDTSLLENTCSKLLTKGRPFTNIAVTLDRLLPTLDHCRDAISGLTEKGLKLVPVLNECELNLRSDVLTPDRAELHFVEGDMDVIGAIRNHRLSSSPEHHERALIQTQFGVQSRLVRLMNSRYERGASGYLLHGLGHSFREGAAESIPQKHDQTDSSFFHGSTDDVGNDWFSMHATKICNSAEEASALFHVPPPTHTAPDWHKPSDSKRVFALHEHTELFDAHYLAYPRTHAFVLLLTNFALRELRQDVEKSKRYS